MWKVLEARLGLVRCSQEVGYRCSACFDFESTARQTVFEDLEKAYDKVL